MSGMSDGERLSWSDAAFLYLEREGMPINVACISLFEGQISLAECRKAIEAKLPLIPRYRQRAAIPPYNIGLPIWEWDPEFDIKRHVREYRLKKGSDEELKDVTGDLLSTVMDREHPLWDFTIVRGLKNNRTAIIIRVHHCMVDGVAGVGLLTTILDGSSPFSTGAAAKQREFVPPPPRDAGTLLLDGVITSCFNIVQMLVKANSELLGAAANAATARLPIADCARFLPELTTVTQRLPFNRLYEGPQRYAWAELSLLEIKAVKNALGVTVNDVVLAVITSTFKRYVERRGTDTTKRLLRIVVPVNLRQNSDESELGNQISFLPLVVPLDIEDPKELVMAVHERMLFLKGLGMANMVGALGALIGTIPTTFQSIAGPVLSNLPISVCNLICTNVPGPQAPLYFLGHKMVAWYPYVPIGGEMGINSAVLTYDGTAYFGFGGEVHAAPDLRALEALVKSSFTEIKAAVGIKPTRKPRTTKKTNKKKVAASDHVKTDSIHSRKEKVLAVTAA